MAVGINLLVVIAAIMLLLFFAVMFLPLRYRLQGGYREGYFVRAFIALQPLASLQVSCRDSKTRGRLRLLYVPIPLPVPGKREKGDKKEDGKKKPGKKAKTKKTKKTEKTKSKNTHGKMFRVLIKRETLEHVLSLVKDLLNILRPDRLEISGRIGFEEPHMGGWLLALLWSLESLYPEVVIDVESLWDQEYYEAEAVVVGKITMGMLLVRLFRFVISRKTIRLFKDLRKLKVAKSVAN